MVFENFTNDSNLLGTQERPAIFGGKDRMNDKMREGLAHEVVTPYNVVIVNANSRRSAALILNELPDHRPEHRSPLVRQSLDWLLGIAPRDAGLGVLSGRVAFLTSTQG